MHAFLYMDQIPYKSILSFFIPKCVLFSATNVVERTIFLPIETPSEQREAPPCSPPLCYNMLIKAADSFCPGEPTERWTR